MKRLSLFAVLLFTLCAGAVAQVGGLTPLQKAIVEGEKAEIILKHAQNQSMITQAKDLILHDALIASAKAKEIDPNVFKLLAQRYPAQLRKHYFYYGSWVNIYDLPGSPKAKKAYKSVDTILEKYSKLVDRLAEKEKPLLTPYQDANLYMPSMTK